MSRDLILLQPTCKIKVEQLMEACERKGVTMRPFCTERTPAEQAKIWRSTRSTEEVNEALKKLDAAGAHYLASVLNSVGPQYAEPGVQGHLTHALPGNSWHQWGEATDCFWVFAKQAVWSTTKLVEVHTEDGGRARVNGYRIDGELAESVGLLSGGAAWGWDWPHVQERQESSPRKTMSWGAIDKAIREKFYVP